jgi:hypothetical protein
LLHTSVGLCVATLITWQIQLSWRVYIRFVCRDTRRVSPGKAKNFHASFVAIFISSESCYQTDYAKREIPPAADTNHRVARPMQIFPVRGGHLRPSSSPDLLIERWTNLSSTRRLSHLIDLSLPGADNSVAILLRAGETERRLTAIAVSQRLRPESTMRVTQQPIHAYLAPRRPGPVAKSEVVRRPASRRKEFGREAGDRHNTGADMV